MSTVSGSQTGSRSWFPRWFPKYGYPKLKLPSPLGMQADLLVPGTSREPVGTALGTSQHPVGVLAFRYPVPATLTPTNHQGEPT